MEWFKKEIDEKVGEFVDPDVAQIMAKGFENPDEAADLVACTPTDEHLR